VSSANTAAGEFTIANFLLSIIPRTLLGALVSGEILQVLFVSILVGIALALTAPRDSLILRGVEEAQTIVFRILGFIMRVAPIGAFGAMAATVAANGGVTLIGLLKFVALFYATCLAFVIVVFGAICRMAGLSLWSVLRLIREEIALVFGTASGEVAFPRLVQKLAQAGCDEAVVGFVLPAGYSFNLDGTAIYLAMAVGFMAQATDTPFPPSDQIVVLAVLLLTSKGGTAVAGGAFVKLAATLQSVRVLPLSGLPLLFSVDRILAIAIALTNIIGNTIAVLVLARWEGAFDKARYTQFMKTLTLTLVLTCVAGVAAQEKPVPKDSERIFINGCAHNRVFTVGVKREDQPGRSDIASGTRLLMNGPKKLMSEIKANESVEVELTGLVRKGDLQQPGIKIGSHVRIGPGPSPTGSNPGRNYSSNQIMIDVEGWRPLAGGCPAK
jgi:Na+/H+-dicarboxylate symporter